MKCYFFFQLAPADKHYDQVCTLEEPEDFRALLRHCEDAGLRKGSVVGNSFMLEVEEDDERVQDLIGLLRSMNRIAVWGSFSPIRQDVRYFCIKRSRVYSKREMDAATFFSNVEWGGNLMCFGKYLENETLCVADSFRPKVKIGGVSKFGGGFLVRNEVKCSLEEKGLNGLNFQEAKFDRNDFMPGEVWKLDSNKHVSDCLLPYFGSIDIDNGETYEVMRYDDSGIIPEQLRFPESISREVSGYDFATVVHEKPSPRWSTANSFIFSKRFKEVLAGFGVSRIRWSPVAFERDS